MSLMECAISVKNCTPCWRWSSLCLTACSPVNTVKARSSPCWICWMSWCHLPLRHCRGSFRCLRSRFVWLCLRPCCLLDDLMPSKSKPRASWARRRSLCWRGHGCVGACLVQRASTCCKAFTVLGEQSPLTFWLPGIKPSAPVVLWKIGIALSGLIWRLIANSRLVCSPCSPFGIITGLLLVVLMRVFLPYNGRNLPRPLTIGWLLWAMLLSLPDCSKVSHGFEPCLIYKICLFPVFKIKVVSKFQRIVFRPWRWYNGKNWDKFTNSIELYWGNSDGTSTVSKGRHLRGTNAGYRQYCQLPGSYGQRPCASL